MNLISGYFIDVSHKRNTTWVRTRWILADNGSAVFFEWHLSSLWCHLVLPKVCQSNRVKDSCCCFGIAMCHKIICIVHALSLYPNDTPSAVWCIHGRRSNTIQIAIYVFHDDCVIDKEERIGHASLMSGIMVVIDVPAQRCWCQTAGLYSLLLLCTSATMLLLDDIIRLCW